MDAQHWGEVAPIHQKIPENIRKIIFDAVLVCEVDERRRRVDRRVSRMLGERVTLARSGSNVQLTITSLCLRLSGQFSLGG
jgi:hypothetical protein